MKVFDEHGTYEEFMVERARAILANVLKFEQPACGGNAEAHDPGQRWAFEGQRLCRSCWRSALNASVTPITAAASAFAFFSRIRSS